MLTENCVWVVSGALFGVLHSLNALFGQGLASTINQIGFTFVVGTVFYMVRRTIGTLLVTMMLHAGWDFSTFALDNTDTSGSGTLGLSLAISITLVAIVIVIVIVMMYARPDEWAPTLPSPQPSLAG